MKKFALCIFLLLIAHVMTASQAESSIVKIRLQATDLSGISLSSVTVGDTFLLSTFVEDLRADDQGVFAAYLDVLYDSSLMSLDGSSIEYNPDYGGLQSGSFVTPGLIDEVGAFRSLPSFNPGAGELLLFSVACRADTVGVVSLFAEEADILPLHDVLVYGMDDPVPLADIAYMSTSVTILSSSTAVPLPPSFSFLTIGVASLFYFRNRLRLKD